MPYEFKRSDVYGLASALGAETHERGEELFFSAGARTARAADTTRTRFRSIWKTERSSASVPGAGRRGIWCSSPGTSVTRWSLMMAERKSTARCRSAP